MKKILSAILAILMISTIVIPAFAAEGTQEPKVVDNTFDNYTPAPGQKAPDNWYDPYCYESDGRINKYCLSVHATSVHFCPEYKRIFIEGGFLKRKDITIYTENGVTYKIEKTVYYSPYEAICENFIGSSLGYKYDPPTEEWINLTPRTEKQWYCPYCGKYECASYESNEQFYRDSADVTHDIVGRVTLGYFCPVCELFMAADSVASFTEKGFEFHRHGISIMGACYHDVDLNNVKLYRFLTEEQRNGEFSFIFKETEMDFGDGKDCRYEDLKGNAAGGLTNWESEDNPHYEPKLTFWQKIVRFFTNIGLWFANLFK